jgi:hypothetical protein
MELTGDPVLDYVELLADQLKARGIEWWRRLPKHLNQWPEDDQRNYIWNMMEVCKAITGSHPAIPKDVFFFLYNGQRPPITG